MTTELANAEIFYTLNGTSPTRHSTRYEGPFELDDDVNLRAVVVADDLADSRIVSASFRFSVASCLTVADEWQSTPISSQEGTFEVLFEATPDASIMNSVMGLSHGHATRYQDLAAIARFSPEGEIDARNGDAYEALSSVAYEPDATYFFRMVVDIPSGTYDVYVRPETSESEIPVATHFAFRTEQVGAYRLDRFSSFAAVGQNFICGLLVPSDWPDEPVESPPDPDNGDEPDPDPDPDPGNGDDPGPDPEPGNGDEEEPDADSANEGQHQSGHCGCLASSSSKPPWALVFALFILMCWRGTRSREALLGRASSRPATL